MPNRLGLYAQAFLMILLAGCAPTPKKPEPAPPSPAIISIEQRVEQGDLLSAARKYQEMSEQAAPAEEQTLLLRALELLVRAEAYAEGERVFRRIEEVHLDSLGRFRYRLAGAEIQQQKAEWTPILGLLSVQPPRTAPAELQARYYELRAQAWQQAGQPLESIRERLRLDALTDDPQRREQNHRSILTSLPQLSETTLEAAFGYADPALNPWLELALIIKRYPLDPGRFAADIRQWRQRFPQHPISQTELDALRAKLEQEQRPPAQIALLLPSGGRFAAAAAAVRDGFLAAYYTDSLGPQSHIRVYDSRNVRNIGQTYASAVRDGAEFVVGPLAKEAVAKLAKTGDLPVPVLALNRIAQHGPPPLNLYQFGLLPEDEAEQAADRAWQDGRRQALVLVPEGTWGDRIAAAFAQRWRELGGTLLEQQRYPPEENDFSDTIRKLLNLDQSKGRRQELKRVLGRDFTYEPRRRQDADFIFLAAFPRQARILRPQLQFHHAGKLPLYATSHVFSGRSQASQDRDVEGLQFCDMPWLLEPGADESLSSDDFAELWPGSPDNHLRLYAMGMDAYASLIQLPRLKSSVAESFAGKTGQLFLDNQHRVRRRLVWAKFTNGRPRSLGFSEPPDRHDRSSQEDRSYEPLYPATYSSVPGRGLPKDGRRPAALPPVSVPSEP